ncbi:MAG: GTPase Era [Chromatiales bacterium]|jgi:GTP-binding protein Era|nr:GTPase Era [Chromatiales bacterium]
MTDNGKKAFRCGFVAIVGRPNVGKSTLLNALIGEKVSIVTPKPQTTRHRILGIDTRPMHQAVFVDTPGFHRSQPRAINRAMNRTAMGSISEADVVLLVVEALRWTGEDQDVLDRCAESGLPLLVAVNKVDTVKPMTRLLPFLESVAAKAEIQEVIPLSATRGTSLERLRDAVFARLPEGPALFPGEMSSDKDERFRIAEIIREKLMLRLHQELPYGLTVGVDELERDSRLMRISAVVWVERSGQKAIVIGQGGSQLKACGQAAREEIEHIWGVKVHLQLWVKVRKRWTDSERALRDLGIDLQ